MIGNPFPLKQNAGKSFQGSIVLGKGFVLSPEEAEALIAKDPRNKDVLFPYLNGDDLNNDPDQRPSRWVINFFDWPEEKARTYPDCFEILEKRVKPERQRWKVDENGNELVGTYALRKPLPQKWWIYGEKRPALYETISQLDQVMVVARISKTLAMCFVEQDMVFADALVVFNNDQFSIFGIMQSTIHNIWAWRYCTTMKSDLNYTPGNVFETYPFPHPKQIGDLEYISLEYHNYRKRLQINLQSGLTKIYNQFHNSCLNLIDNDSESIDDKIFEKKYGKDSLWLKRHLQNVNCITYNESIKQIEHLRTIHIKIDYAVLNAYGWNDIPLKHDFYELEYLPENDRTRFTIHPCARIEILKRLLALNHQLHSLETESSEPIVIKKDSMGENSPLTLF